MLQCFSTLASLSAVSAYLTQQVNVLLHIEKAQYKQIVSWIVAIALSIIGFITGAGLFAAYGAITEPIAWVYTIVTGFGIGLTSNGLYDINVIKQLLEFVSLFKNQSNDKDSVN